MRKAYIPEVAQEQYYRAAAGLAGIPVYEIDGLSWMMGDRKGYPKGIFNTSLKKRELDRRVPDIAQRMRGGQLPDVWTETPRTRPKGLEKYLLGHGFVQAWPAAGMVLESQRLTPRPPIQANYTVQLLADGACIPGWSRVVAAELFRGDEETALGFTDFIGQIWRDGHFQLFAAFQGERLLGTSLLYMAGGLAYIAYVAVASDARRQGIGSLVTWQACAFARDRGIKTVALHASVLGEPVYTKLGFKVVSRFHRLRLAE